MTNHGYKLYLLAALLLATVATATGADKQRRLTGDWKVDVEKSDFGMLFAPKSATIKIDQKDPNFKFSDVEMNEQGETSRTESNCTTNGKECTVTLIATNYPATGTMKWDGSSLIFDGSGSSSGIDFQIHEKWDLSQDGKTITVSRQLSSTRGNTSQTIVLDK